jgi:hypothetical protein
MLLVVYDFTSEISDPIGDSTALQAQDRRAIDEFTRRYLDGNFGHDASSYGA